MMSDGTSNQYIPRAQRRLLDNWVGIVLTVVSIIQGLAFNDLVVLFPPIYAYTVHTGQPIVIIHFLLCLALLFRVFQTYVTAALDYDDWEPSFFDVLIIFAIGFVEYFIFAGLTVPHFDVVNFHQRLTIIAFLAFLGYLQAYLRLKESDYPSYQEYRREQRLQIGNILGGAAVLAISLFIIFGPRQSAMVYSALGGLDAVILIANMQYSLAITFSARRRRVRIPRPADAGQPPREVQLTTPLQIRPATRDDVMAIDDLIIDNFGYIYANLFDTSPRMTKKVFRSLLLARGGRHALGYRSFVVATSEVAPQEEHVVGVLHLSNRALQTPVATLRSLAASLFIALRSLGIIGVVRTLINVRKARDLASIVERDEMHIDYIAVVEHYRKQGIGAALMAYAKDVARAQNKLLVSLEVRERNAMGLRFFETAGFHQDAVIAGKSDAIFGQGARTRMVWDVTAAEQVPQAAALAPSPPRDFATG